ncbi:MAG TPA: DUF4377 domain-containing protein [archaeon]|nr:DUF4377 domain-containing protein [archaeon]
MKKIVFVGLFLFTLTLFLGCVDQKIKTFEIGPKLIDCQGVGPMKCMVVNGGNFYNQIEGFTFEEGYNYTISVTTDKIENPPADGSSIKYTLIKVISKKLNLEKEFLNKIAQSMLDENINQRDGYDSIIKCDYLGKEVYQTKHTHCCDFGTNIYNINGEIICSFNGFANINTCPDYNWNRTDCETIWTTKKD